MFSNMKARLILRRRIELDERSLAEVVIWAVPKPLSGSKHGFKYRLAYVVDGTCVLRFDNETGKGDHIHRGSEETRYEFTTAERLLRDFWSEVERLRN
jgi:hypothetical protein